MIALLRKSYSFAPKSQILQKIKNLANLFDISIAHNFARLFFQIEDFYSNFHFIHEKYASSFIFHCSSIFMSFFSIIIKHKLQRIKPNFRNSGTPESVHFIYEFRRIRASKKMLFVQKINKQVTRAHYYTLYKK